MAIAKIVKHKSIVEFGKSCTFQDLKSQKGQIQNLTISHYENIRTKKGSEKSFHPYFKMACTFKFYFPDVKKSVQ